MNIVNGSYGPVDYTMPTARRAPVLTIQRVPTGIQDSLPCRICDDQDEPAHAMPPIASTFDCIYSYVRPSYMGEMAYA